MLKNVLYLVLLTLIVTIFIHEFALTLNTIYHFYNWIQNQLAAVFAGGAVGRIIREGITLFGIPLLIGLAANGCYWAIQRRKIPKFSEIVWVLWLILVVTVAVHTSAA